MDRALAFDAIAAESNDARREEPPTTAGVTPLPCSSKHSALRFLAAGGQRVNGNPLPSTSPTSAPRVVFHPRPWLAASCHCLSAYVAPVPAVAVAASQAGDSTSSIARLWAAAANRRPGSSEDVTVCPLSIEAVVHYWVMRASASPITSEEPVSCILRRAVPASSCGSTAVSAIIGKDDADTMSILRVLAAAIRRVLVADFVQQAAVYAAYESGVLDHLHAVHRAVYYTHQPPQYLHASAAPAFASQYVDAQLALKAAVRRRRQMLQVKEDATALAMRQEGPSERFQSSSVRFHDLLQDSFLCARFASAHQTLRTTGVKRLRSVGDKRDDADDAGHGHSADEFAERLPPLPLPSHPRNAMPYDRAAGGRHNPWATAASIIISKEAIRLSFGSLSPLVSA